MALDHEQRHVLGEILRIGRKRGAQPIEIRAAVATGLVESGLRNLSGGDADSAGWRQERSSLYADPTNLRASINRFFDETKAVRGRYGKAGELAAAVQRPAAQYRGRYQANMGQAKALIRQFGVQEAGRAVSGSGGAQAAGGAATQPVVGAGSDILTRVATMLQGSRAGGGVGASAPAPPAFSAGPTTAGALQAPSGGSPAAKSAGLSDALAQVAAPVDTSVPGTQQQAGGQAGVAPQQEGGGVQGRTLYIGDSLGVGTEPNLKKLLGGHVDANVVGGRSSADGIKALRAMVGKRGYRNLVLDLGTNDMTAKQLEQSVRAASRVTPDRVQIFIPTLNGPFATKAKNAVLHRLAEADPRITLVPWHAHSGGHLAGDGIHATSSGYQTRAQLVAQALGWTAPAQQGGRGSLKITGPNPGRIKPIVVHFAERVSAVLGRPLTGSDGTGHSYLTTSGNVSEHTTGNAIDIPMRGAELVRAGRAALIAAGWSRKRAMGVNGGLFNVYETRGGKRIRHQIIFNTQEGGDHTDHLHISSAYR